MIKEIINIGVLAHVDAGKTTVTEALLHRTGVIRTLGRVDKGTAATDSLEVEKQRGITVKEATVSFEWNNIKINLLDTPGHADFIAEVERALAVLDGAILVISAKESVQAQTRVIFYALRELKIPTIIFINKLDRFGVKLGDVYGDIRKRLTQEIVPLQAVTGEGGRDFILIDWRHDPGTREMLSESVATLDEALLEKYANNKEITDDEIVSALMSGVNGLKICPVLHGAALRGMGIDELLNAITELLPQWEDGDIKTAFGDARDKNGLTALVYKIKRDERGVKKAYARVFQGRLAMRETYLVDGEAFKIKSLENIWGSGLTAADEVAAGDIAVFPAGKLKIGDVIGQKSEYTRRLQIAKPTLRAAVTVESGADTQKRINDDHSQTALLGKGAAAQGLQPMRLNGRSLLIQALLELSEEDPLLGCEIDPFTDEISVMLIGEIQMEILRALMKERYGIVPVFSDTVTLFKEKPKRLETASSLMGDKNNPYRAGITLSIEPGEINSGVDYESRVSYGYIEKPFQNAVREGVMDGLRQGVHGWEVTDIKIRFIGAQYDSVSSTPADFRDLVPLVLMEALINSGTDLLEPMLKFDLRIPTVSGGQVMADLNRMRAVISEYGVYGDEAFASGMIPADTSKSYHAALHMHTGGKAIFDTSLSHYQILIGETREMHRKGYDATNRVKYLLQKSNRLK